LGFQINGLGKKKPKNSITEIKEKKVIQGKGRVKTGLRLPAALHF